MTQDIYPAPRAPGLMERVIFTSSGTFTKADYPGAQSVLVRVQGAGGGSGGTISTTGGGGGGGAGGYAESLLDIGTLASSETVTVGSGGSGATGGSDNATNGGVSSFGSHVAANGGGTGKSIGSGSSNTARGGAGGDGTAGEIQITGQPGENGSENSNATGGGNGGNSVLGSGGRGFLVNSGSFQGNAGMQGGGGGAGFSAGSTNTSGASGGDGIVIVEVYSTYVGNTGDFATRDYVQGAILGSVNRFAVLGTTDSTSNLNTSTPTAFSWNAEDFDGGDWVHSTSTNPERLEANFSGIARIQVQLEITSTVERANIRVRVRKNGSTYLRGAGASGYIRALNGHNESSVELTVIDTAIQDGDYYEVMTEEYASVGTVNAITDGCVLSAERLA